MLNRKITTSVSLSSEALERLEAARRRRDTSRSEVLERLVLEHLPPVEGGGA